MCLFFRLKLGLNLLTDRGPHDKINDKSFLSFFFFFFLNSSVIMSFFSFGQSAEIDVVLSDAETRKKAEHKSEDGKKDKYFLFYDGETVSGKVNVTLKNPGKRLEHHGIKIEFVGQIGGFKHQLCPTHTSCTPISMVEQRFRPSNFGRKLFQA